MNPHCCCTAQRLGVLAANIANADTPGYKARDIDFAAVLSNTDQQRPLALAVTQPAHIVPGGGDSSAAELKYRNPYQASLDGNTVEMPVEQAAFSENNVRYQASLTFINSHDRRSAVRDRRRQERATMSLFNVFNIAGSALNAETVRLNTTASNLANAESSDGDSTKVYRARHPVFQTMMDGAADDEEDTSAGVRVLGVVESQAPPSMRYEPNNPTANKDGYVFGSNVNPIEEMTNMISANRAFATNIDAINTARDLLLKVISMGH